MREGEGNLHVCPSYIILLYYADSQRTHLAKLSPTLQSKIQ